MRSIRSAAGRLGLAFAAVLTGIQPVVAVSDPGISIPLRPSDTNLALSAAPASFLGLNIGSPGLAGTAVENNGMLTLEGGGADIWGAADQFYLHYVRLPEAGYVVARVVSLENTDPWAKAGVMIRATGDANSAHAFMGVTAANGLAFQRRTATGSESEHTGLAGAAPRWVRLTRAGNFVSAAHSMDGIAWTVVGSVTLPLREYALVGLAVSSHNNATLATAVFDHVEIQEGGTGLYLGNLTWTDNGNGDGVPNPGEELTLTARVYNPGTVEARAVTGSFSLSDPYASLVSGQADFGNIPVRGFSEYRKFRFLVSPDVPKPYTVNLSLELKDFWGVVKHSTHPIYISESFTISGTVRWANGDPLVNAHVICGNRGGTKDQVTDSQGRYTFSMRPSEYLCRAEWDGMSSPVVRVLVPPSKTNVDFSFTPSLSVSGTVRMDNGDPVVDAFVSCFTGEIYSSYYNRTDAQGRYTLSLPTSGSYICNVSSDYYQTPSVTIVVPPSQTGLNFTIPTFPTVSGTVRLSNGEPVFDASVSCYNDKDHQSNWSDAQGRYTIFILKPGSYKCNASYKGASSATTVLEVPPSHADVDFVVLPLPELTLDRAGFSDTLEVGRSRSQPLVISNSGGQPLEFNFENTQSGYVWQDSDSPGGPAYAWTDIRNSGARLNLTGGLSRQVAVQTLSFGFPFYGNLQNTVYVAPSGYLTFVDAWYYSSGTVLPTLSGAPKQMIAPFWGKIEARDVYFQEFPDRAVFQYDQVPSTVTSDTSTFQVVLYRDGTIRYYYNTITRPSLGLVGMQNEIGDKGFTLTKPYYQDTGVYPLIIKDAFAVEFRPLARDWFTASPASGTVPPGGSITIDIGLDAGSLSVGTNQGKFKLNHNA
ncbi:MAG TPA: carboxypeptidase regulatory-like domain-containing protein, partial [Fibrobacteria bacterium]|nr:carboxypeptidase regulatory-like domain-containing protein [Fibrobacteria bacterium]